MARSLGSGDPPAVLCARSSAFILCVSSLLLGGRCHLTGSGRQQVPLSDDDIVPSMKPTIPVEEL